MRCRLCGYVSLEARERCPGCGAPAFASGPAPGPEDAPPAKPRRSRRRGGASAPPPGSPTPPVLEPGRPAGRAPRAPAPEQLVLPIAGSLPPPRRAAEEDPTALVELAGDENLPDADVERAPFEAESAAGAASGLEDDLIPPALPGPQAPSRAAAPDPGAAEIFRLPYETAPAAGGGDPAIIDRDDEVPERFWAAEGARLGRRAAAAAIDALALGALVAVFATGAWIALRSAGLEAGQLFGEQVLRAVLLPFGLLALLLSLAYSVAFHAAGGGTPGKRLAGLEVRAVDGRPLTVGRCLLRWLAAGLAVGAAGAGVLWALLEPRRRGWADLLSGTVIVERRPGREPGP